MARTVDKILSYLSRRAATPEHLASNLELSAEEVRVALDNMQQKGLVSAGAAWYGNDQSTAITVITLTPTGRAENERREAKAADWEREPVLLTRDELVTELRTRFDWSEQKLASDPNLQGDHFDFWPSIGAWSRVSSGESHGERIGDAAVSVWRHQDGRFRVSRYPDEGQEGHPGHTYSPGDFDLPSDFPTSNDPVELMSWARKRWG